MAKKTYPKLTTGRGVFIYPRFDEPDTKFVKPHGEYHTKFALDMDSEDFTNLVAAIEKVRDEFWEEKQAELKKAKKTAAIKKAAAADFYEEEFDDEGNETGRAIFKFKLAAVVETEKKSWQQRPAIFDAGNPEAGLAPQQIKGATQARSGTEGKVNLELFPYFMESTKEYGVSLRMRGVQILKLVSGGVADAEGMGFGAEEGYTAPATDSGFAAEDSDDSTTDGAEEEEF